MSDVIDIGRIEALFRYPVKSMAGERVESAMLGFHGIEGDRRLALRKVDDRGPYPFLTAGKLAELVRFTPVRSADAAEDSLPTHVRTPEGALLPVMGDELAAEISRRVAAPMQMMHLRTGIFDDASISVIATATLDEICALAAMPSDVRRFRPNIVVRLAAPTAFAEDAWVGGTLTFGEGTNAPTVSVTQRDIRCAMLNIDPETAGISPAILKAVVRVNENNAGVYGTVTRAGGLAVGQRIFFKR
jgi:hypothetical protein